MTNIYSFEGMTPVVAPTTFVHPTAVLIGDVIIGPGCYIGPGASLRGDFGRIVIGAGCNAQDNVIIHVFPGGDCVVEDWGHIGHGAVLHGCVVRRNALIGINAVVLDKAQIGESAIVAANAVVRAGETVPERTLVGGTPARFIRQLSEGDVEAKKRATAAYHLLAEACLTDLVKAAPLTAVEPDRGRTKIGLRVSPELRR